MSRSSTVLALACAFVVGCVAASQVIVPAHAQQQPAPSGAKKWEQFCSYRMSFSPDMDKVTSEANADLKAKGAEGWELVSASLSNGNILSYCFRRPAP